jgi:hypothetical protein
MESVSGAGLLKRSGFRKKCENENLENLSVGPGPSDRFVHTPQKENNREIRGNLRKISSNLKIICIFAALKRI